MDGIEKELSGFCLKYCKNDGDKIHCKGCIRKHDFLYGYKKGQTILCERITNLEETIKKLKAEIEELKKQKIDWHTITCFDEPDEDGFITHDNPSDVGYDFLIRLKSGSVTVDTLTECDQGIIFENYEWQDIESWAYIPERIRVVNSEKK